MNFTWINKLNIHKLSHLWLPGGVKLTQKNSVEVIVVHVRVHVRVCECVCACACMHGSQRTTSCVSHCVLCLRQGWAEGLQLLPTVSFTRTLGIKTLVSTLCSKRLTHQVILPAKKWVLLSFRKECPFTKFSQSTHARLCRISHLGSMSQEKPLTSSQLLRHSGLIHEKVGSGELKQMQESAGQGGKELWTKGSWDRKWEKDKSKRDCPLSFL